MLHCVPPLHCTWQSSLETDDDEDEDDDDDDDGVCFNHLSSTNGPLAEMCSRVDVVVVQGLTDRRPPYSSPYSTCVWRVLSRRHGFDSVAQ